MRKYIFILSLVLIVVLVSGCIGSPQGGRNNHSNGGTDVVINDNSVDNSNTQQETNPSKPLVLSPDFSSHKEGDVTVVDIDWSKMIPKTNNNYVSVSTPYLSMFISKMFPNNRNEKVVVEVYDVIVKRYIINTSYEIGTIDRKLDRAIIHNEDGVYYVTIYTPNGKKYRFRYLNVRNIYPNFYRVKFVSENFSDTPIFDYLNLSDTKEFKYVFYDYVSDKFVDYNYLKPSNLDRIIIFAYYETKVGNRMFKKCYSLRPTDVFIVKKIKDTPFVVYKWSYDYGKIFFAEVPGFVIYYHNSDKIEFAFNKSLVNYTLSAQLIFYHDFNIIDKVNIMVVVLNRNIKYGTPFDLILNGRKVRVYANHIPKFISVKNAYVPVIFE